MPIRRYFINPIADLEATGKLSGVLLLLATAISIALSNSDNATQYIQLWDLRIGFSFLNKTILHWINDGLMVIFFFLVGLEIKRETVTGELARPRQALLPIIAAAGGIFTPAIIYLVFNIGSPDNLRGWAIPTATDIAFSLAILTLLGKRVPISLKIFLTALAIIDDLGAILIIAFFYTAEISLIPMLLAVGIIALLLLLNRLNTSSLAYYFIPGVLLWYFILKSGVHPTIAGVIMALAIPLNLTRELEHKLPRPVNYMILPLFAMANTAIPLDMGSMEMAFGGISLGILFGLIIGKPMGILLFSYLGARVNLVSLPEGVTWKMIAGVGLVAGIGFTMSLFIAALSFDSASELNIAKLAVIAGSILSALCGYFLLRNTTRHYLPE